MMVAAVSGNWYDVPHKANVLAGIVRVQPEVTLLLTGGRDERLTLPSATALGGEPLSLQQELHERHRIPRARMVLYTGSRITNHNLLAMLFYAKQTLAFERRALVLEVVEEGFLMRRAAAAMHALLERDPTARRALASVRFRSAGAVSFDDLVAVHGGHVDVALALVLGELRRLKLYSRRTAVAGVRSRRNTTAAVDELLLPADAGDLPSPELRREAERLWQQHRHGLYASGSSLLSNRTLLTTLGAVPQQRAM